MISAPRKTSETDPLRVDFLPESALPIAGRIGMTLAPGKKDLSSSGRWSRDLSADLTRLRTDYRTTALVSLLEDFELDLLGIPSLVRDAEGLGIRTLRFPIVDGSVPRDLPATRALVADLLHRATSGETLVLHCRAGLGRTGLLAACCLVAHGHAPSEAMRLVRLARARTIENDAQEAFVRAFGVR